MPATTPVTEPKLARLSRERYDAMIANGILTKYDRVELLNGFLYEQMSKGPRHNAGVMRASELLTHKLGKRAMLGTQNSIALHEYSEPEPDIAVLRPRADYYATSLAEPKDVLFMIEVSDSTLRYDRDLKIPLYAASDIAEVWLVDVAARTVTVYRQPQGNRYSVETVYRSGDSIPLTAFPGESIAAADLGL